MKIEFISGSISGIFYQFILLVTGFQLISCNPGENNLANHNNPDTIVSVINKKVEVGFSLSGGALIDFHFHRDGVNPFTWKLAVNELPIKNIKGATFQGHFLCLGRWGAPTSGEMKLGMPHNGEPANKWWMLTGKTDYSITMQCNAPLEGVSIQKEIVLSKNDALISIRETFSNQFTVARNLPIVQHATIGLPFLDSAVIVNSNATIGFNQKFVPDSIEKYESNWPYMILNTSGDNIDVRKSNGLEGYVATYVIEDSMGWVVAYSPKYKTLIGYVWQTNDYPWLHIWQGIKDQKLWAKGLEFGTTGLGDTAPINQRFSLNFHTYGNNNYLDAKASVTKSYYCFQIKLDQGFKEVNKIACTQNELIVSVLTDAGNSDIKLSLN